MARMPRSELPDGHFHLTAIGAGEAHIFLVDLDRIEFLHALDIVCSRFAWRLLAYCLMGTHYHFVLHVPEDGLSVGMCELNGGFARWSNFRHGCEDHVFGRRFASVEILRDEHLREACRYVVLNPVRAGLVDHPGDWPWSSYRATVGDEHPPACLALGAVLAMFGDRPRAAVEAYREYVEAGRVLCAPGPVPGTVPRV